MLSTALLRRAIFRKPTTGDGVANDVGARAQLELLDRTCFVRLDRLDTETELGGDLLVALAPRDRAQHLFFATRQRVTAIVADLCGSGRRKSVLKEGTGEPGLDVHAALRHDAD